MQSSSRPSLRCLLACLAVKLLPLAEAFIQLSPSLPPALVPKKQTPMPCRRTPCRSRATLTELMMEVIDCDVAIIGGGPAGCTCGLYTARGNLKTVIIDKNPSAGALAITSTIANYPGADATTSGLELLDNMRQQAVDYGADYRRAQVFMVDFDAERDTKIVYTPDVTVNARSLVFATGALGRKPIFRGEADFLGKGVSYCATCDGAFYQQSPVAVVGVTTEAIQEAEFLTKFASTVHWITPSPIQGIGEGGDNEAAMDLLAHDNVKHWVDTRMLEVKGDESGVTGIQLQQKDKDEPEHLDTEGVFIYDTGSKPITDYIGSKVEFNKDGGVAVNDEMATNVPGVYAIGDIRNTPYKQVVVAASDGCIAAMAIDRYLKGRKTIKVDWHHQ